MHAAPEQILHAPHQTHCVRPSRVFAVPSSPWGSHSPLVLATIHGMQTCGAIQAVLQECAASKSDDHICDSAALYFKACVNTQKGGLNNSYA
jgi:hypothetical protein